MYDIFVWNNLSIRNKFLSSVLLVFLLLYSPTLFYTFKQSKHNLFESARIESLSIARILSLELFRNYELTKDRREIQSVLVGAKRSNSDILELTVFDKAGKVLNSTFDKRRGDIVSESVRQIVLNNKSREVTDIGGSEPLLTVLYPISAGPGAANVSLGGVELRLSLQRHLEQLDVVRRNLLIAGFLIVAVMTLVIMKISASITNPIQTLYKGMNAANDGDLSVRVPVESRDEIGYASKTFNDMLASIQMSDRELRDLTSRLREAERLEVIATFTSVLAHQLKNPLSIIKGAISSLQRRRNDFDSSVLQFIDILDKESKRTMVVVERFLAFAKKQELVKRDVLAEGFIADTLRSFEAEPVSICVQTNFDKELELELDLALMTEALLNILNNAKEALLQRGVENPVIRLAADIHDKDFCVTIEDNAGGIPPDVAEKIFEPFYSTKAKGTGLGLSMAHKIVTLHGGRLTLASGGELDGACVQIVIPCSSSTS